MTPTTYGRDFAYCLKSHGGVRGFNASLWRFLLRCTLFCHSVATFLTSVSSYEGGCGFEGYLKPHIVYSAPFGIYVDAALVDASRKKIAIHCRKVAIPVIYLNTRSTT